ncbi:hypothetical protein N431DRAFT_458616 [Stipitochalara longipes BDJ]|nr:hypothetical protein N431DRAFT_458616 [Stipitochalara longipes BDJ]
MVPETPYARRNAYWLTTNRYLPVTAFAYASMLKLGSLNLAAEDVSNKNNEPKPIKESTDPKGSMDKEEIEYTMIKYPNPNPNVPDPNSELPIMKLSPDLHVQLLALLDEVTATCLGLTCRRLYGSYRRLYACPPNPETNIYRRLQARPLVDLNTTVIVPVGEPRQYRWIDDLIWGGGVSIQKFITEEIFEKLSMQEPPYHYRKEKRDRCRKYDGCLICRWIRRGMAKQGIVEQKEQKRLWDRWCPKYDACGDCRSKISYEDRQWSIKDPVAWAKDKAEREERYLAFMEGEINEIDERMRVLCHDDYWN